MKARELHTIHDIIITDYTVTALPSGKYMHTFHPATTPTIYQFEGNSAPVLKDGDRYNVGFTLTPAGQRIVDRAAMGKVNTVNKYLSYQAAIQLSTDIEGAERAKNDQRVTHSATDGYYWGKKYAWRMYGLVMAKDAFYAYLDEIKHPSVACTTLNPDLPYSSGDASKAYRDEGLREAMDDLIETAVQAGRYFKSPLYASKFQIKPIDAITDKK